MKRYKNLLAMVIITMFTVSCSSTRFSQLNGHVPYKKLSTSDKQLADTLIKKVLDNEGLYTVISKLKPMSSVTELYLSLTTADTLARGNSEITDTTSADLKKLKQYQRVVNSLKFGDLKFMISPYRLTQKEMRPMQISVHRQSLIDSLLKAEQSFFGQFGFVPGTSSGILVNTTEYEHKYNRFRAYGYLFGYPEHAVDFFTEASINNDKTGVFVKRDFFQIPVFNAAKGHFVYAVPQNYTATVLDSTILNRAKFSLAVYEQMRQKFQRSDGSIQYYKLLKKLIKSER